MTEKPKTEEIIGNELDDIVFQEKRNVVRERSDLQSVQRVIDRLMKEGEILPSTMISEVSRIVAEELKKIEDI